MSNPLRLNLEVHTDTDGTWVRCTRCLNIFGSSGEDWRKTSKRRLLPPTKAGPLMALLDGRFLLEQLSCPSCGALLDTDLVEETKEVLTVEKGKPSRPEPKPVKLKPDFTAAAVLDLSTRCHDPKDVCSRLLEPLGTFLERARAHGVPIIFTISASAKGTALGEVAFPLKRRETEPVIYPDAFDKFTGGELQDFLSEKRAQKLIVVGSVANVSVLYTSTTATRVYGYHVILPVDGVNARTEYEQEYAFHQLTVLPKGANKLIHFTTLSMIDFDAV